MKVLEFKHHAPADGVFWRWEYVPFYQDEVDGTFHAFNISTEKWPYKEKPKEILEHGLLELDLKAREYDWRWQYDRFSVWDWDEDLHTHLPDNWFPVFSDFADRHGLVFWWECDECGIGTAETPIEMAGYRGNGGVGIEVEGWLCDSCFCLQQAKEEAERAAEKQLEAEEKAAAMLEDDYDWKTYPARQNDIYIPPDNQLSLSL